MRDMTEDAAHSPEPEVMLAVADRLIQAAQNNPKFTEANVSRMLRQVPGKRSILLGKLGARDAVFRVYHGDRQTECERHWTELQRIWPTMQDGHLRVNEPLACDVSSGVIAVAYVSGDPLLGVITKAKTEVRLEWLHLAARWLNAYASKSEFRAEADTNLWVKRAVKASEKQAFADLRRIEGQISGELDRIAHLLRRQNWRYAICHGDFHPNNLIADRSCLTGIDCGNSKHIPIYKDIARFLMHLGRRGVMISGETHFGVDAKGFEIFSYEFGLNEQERELTLPFFLGVEALLRAETKGLPERRIKKARQMSRALLDDLKNLKT